MKAISLLETKLFRPPPRPDRVARPHLISRLNEGLQPGCRLALISAPAGFGKTTLISSWAEACTYPISWLSLDREDNSPLRFWSYLASASNTLETGTGDVLLSSLHFRQSPPEESQLVDFINKLNRLSFPAVLILDDFHLISDPVIFEGVSFLIQHLPNHIHFVIATRADPPWPLARLRSNGQIIELRTKDLRFTTREVEILLKDVMGLPLSPASVSALDRRTEGWIAGLHLAALTLQGNKDADIFVDQFSASHRFVMDYLIEEVLEQLPADMVSFLLQTSILDRLSEPLCNTVTQRSDASRLLTMIDAMNLFIIRLDDAGHWYRYHHLFANMLRSRLHQASTYDIAGLHRRASAWFQGVGLIPEAFHHALSSEDYEQAARVIEGNVMAMLDYRDLKTLTAWLDKLPQDFTRTRPWLCLARAWILTYTGLLEKTYEFLESAAKIQTHYEHTQHREEARHIAGHITAIRAYHTAYQRNFRGAVDLCSRALTLLPMADATTRCFTSLLYSAMLRRMGELDPAGEVLDRALQNEALPADSHTAILAKANLGILWRVRGKLHQAAAVFSGILAENAATTIQINRHIPASALGLAYVGLAEINREWNNLTAAETLINDAVERGERWGSVDMLSGAYLQLARIMQALENEAGMRLAIDKLLNLVQEKLPGMVPIAKADCAAIMLSFGDVNAASAWLKNSARQYDDAFEFQDRRPYITLARVLLAQGQLKQANKLLTRLSETIEKAGAVSDLIQILVLQALLHYAQGSIISASDTMARAFTLAEPEGFIRVFLDLGPQMIDLLRQPRIAGLSPHYADTLLAAESAPQPELAKSIPPSTTPATPTQAGLMEPLSDRELEILRLLRSSMTNGEIANHLHVSVNTVRTHIQHIYQKLDVHRRFDAVERAKKLGVL